MPARFQPIIESMVIKELIKQHLEKRKYIRHPTEISIDYRISGNPSPQSDVTKDISYGGLCFRTKAELEPGTPLSFKIPSINPNLEISGRVVWCSSRTDYFEVGVEFQDENDAYRARIIEEICHLKQQQKNPTSTF